MDLSLNLRADARGKGVCLRAMVTSGNRKNS
jgi:hypothetical protein